MMKNLSELPEYVRTELSEFLAETCFSASETLIIEHKGVQVSLRFERDEDEFMEATPMFEVKP